MGAENNTPLLSREEYYFELSVLAHATLNFRIVDRSEKKKKCAKVCKICNSVGVTTVTLLGTVTVTTVTIGNDN